MNNQLDDHIHTDVRLRKKSRESHPLTRKSRSISRYFLGSKHSSIDLTAHDTDITRCLTSFGIFDSYDLWASVTLFRDYRTCRRLFILTNKNELIVGKTNQKRSLLKIKYRIDLNRVWLYTNIENLNESIVSEITPLTYYDYHRTLILGWPLVENFLVEFDSKDIRDIWYTRIQSNLNFWWQLNNSNFEHVRIVIDQNQECDQNNNTTSFLIRKVINIRPQETVRDLIKKCIDACHLRDACVDNYILFALNDSSTMSSTQSSININQLVNSSPQSNQTQLIPLIGHEYPYAIKMKHLKPSNQTSFDGDDRSSLHSAATMYSNHNTSTTSLNNISMNSHDFELRKRDVENQNKKHRFFHKRKTKDHSSKSSVQQQQQYSDDYHSSSTATPLRTKSSNQFFGQTFDELIKKYNNQIPPVIQQLLEVLYYKGPDTTGIFRKVANTRSVKDAIDKIERNVLLPNEDLHPILAAGIFKHFLRTLPEPVFNTIQYDNWKKCLRLPAIQEKISFARKSTLSESNHLLLKGLICILYRISQNSDTNGMNAFNLGLCVSNSLFKTESTTIASGKQEADVMSSIVEFLILNCTSLFGSDVTTCIPDKHIIVHHIPNLTRPTASSIESLDEVESSPHVPIVNRSRDSGLATSDQPFNDDSSEISEHFRRHTSAIRAIPPNWTTSIACGTGTVLSSIIIPTTILSLSRYRNSKNLYKPSKQFMERDKLTNDTTDDSDHDEFNGTIGDSSVRSSTTTVNNISIGKIKRSKPILRHSSLGNNEYYQKYQQQLTKEAKRVTANDVKRASSLKQFHHGSDEADDDDEQNKTLNANANNNNNNNNNSIKRKTSINTKKNEQILTSTPVINRRNLTNERRSKLVKSKTTNSDEESMTTRSIQLEQQDLDLTTEPLSTINQRYTNISATRSASFNIATTAKKFDSPSSSLLVAQPLQTCLSIDRHTRQPTSTTDGRSRHNGPLAATTNQIYATSRNEHHSQTNTNASTKSERDRTFIHHSDCRPFKLGTAIQMKPIDDILLSSNGRCRPCHRQNALRYKAIDKELHSERQSRQSTPIPTNKSRLYSNEHPPTNITRYQSIERRVTTPTVQPTKPLTFDINDELRSSDISWSVREKAKLFEHINHKKLSTGRENYV
ncbi:unnamed protein product [Rotaria magnacalcarata]|uniref:Rho-GAP domain-containing protein n=1 Tax=Rotaria magnacalcarata TaxID=392030 RepID=A0A815Z8H8_9BILA|nr:unnamed protein product [Rotaria magnacalcarata]CAF1637830.1 unnamed protein product [Rotaria magnacalcarata]CAF1907656.1 unnamed protein product [Rotaria magnacalcarata]